MVSPDDIVSAISQLLKGVEYSDENVEEFCSAGIASMYGLYKVMGEGLRLLDFGTVMIASEEDGKSVVLSNDLAEQVLTRVDGMFESVNRDVVAQRASDIALRGADAALREMSGHSYAWRCMCRSKELGMAFVFVQKGLIAHFTSDNNVYREDALDESDILRVMFRALRPSVRHALRVERVLCDWTIRPSADAILNALHTRVTCARCNIRTRECFRKCGGCGSVRYCSRGCQKKHWKEEHKELCKGGGALGDSVAVRDIERTEVDIEFLRCCKPWPTV